MQFIKAQLSDIALLRDFAERTFRIAYEADNEPGPFNAYCREAFTLEQFRRELEHPFSAFWLGWIDGQLAAYLKLNFDNHPEILAPAKTVQIERIYVESTFQGQGLGENALNFAYQQALDVQAEWIWLSVWQKNPRAVRFYERCGYEICGTEIFPIDDDMQVDWLMRKRVVF